MHTHTRTCAQNPCCRSQVAVIPRKARGLKLRLKGLPALLLLEKKQRFAVTYAMVEEGFLESSKSISEACNMTATLSIGCSHRRQCTMEEAGLPGPDNFLACLCLLGGDMPERAVVKIKAAETLL